jgi:hypothetical protein
MMPSGRKRSSYRSQRSESGGSLVAAIVGLFVFLSIFAPVGVFLSNIAAQQLFQSQASHIADQACEVVNDWRYWLDLERPGFKQNMGSTKTIALSAAKNAAEQMCATLGLADANAAVSVDDGESPGQQSVRCILTVKNSIPFPIEMFGFDMKKQFPPAISVTRVSVHKTIGPYGIIMIDAPDNIVKGIAGPFRNAAVIPVYGLLNKGAIADPTDTTPATAWGKGMASIGDTENFFALNGFPIPRSHILMMNGDQPPANPLQNSFPFVWNAAHIETVP